MPTPDLLGMAQALLPVASRAAKEILAIYDTPFDVEHKADDSPLTEADLTSQHVIAQALERLFPDIPQLSEEERHAPWNERRQWQRFFLVDPLDGTKEFVNRNGEFTVNIALVQDHSPVLGVIHLPVQDIVYYGGPGLGAFCIEGNGAPRAIACAAPGPQGPVMLVSRSHPSTELTDYASRHGIATMRPAGAATKFCRLAEGSAHVYPRFNLTMEWDTAAGQALLEGAGGTMTHWDGSPFLYNKQSLKNSGFIAQGGR